MKLSTASLEGMGGLRCLPISQYWPIWLRPKLTLRGIVHQIDERSQAQSVKIHKKGLSTEIVGFGEFTAKIRTSLVKIYSVYF